MQRVVISNDILLPEVVRLLGEGNEVILRTKGASMLPFIWGNRDSVVLVRPVNVNVGDIVLAQVKEDDYVLHRVIGSDNGSVTLMGDGNLSGCEVCRYEDIKAVAKMIIRDGKTIDCTSRGYIRAVRLWRFLLPARRYILAIYRRLYRYNYY